MPIVDFRHNASPVDKISDIKKWQKDNEKKTPQPKLNPLMKPSQPYRGRGKPNSSNNWQKNDRYQARNYSRNIQRPSYTNQPRFANNIHPSQQRQFHPMLPHPSVHNFASISAPMNDPRHMGPPAHFFPHVPLDNRRTIHNSVDRCNVNGNGQENLPDQTHEDFLSSRPKGHVMSKRVDNTKVSEVCHYYLEEDPLKIIFMIMFPSLPITEHQHKHDIFIHIL